MAYIVSEKYRQHIYDEDGTQLLDILNGEEKINEDYIVNVALDDECFETENFTLGSAIPVKLELEISNDYETPISEITLVHYIEYDDGTKEEVPVGKFYVDEISKNDYSTSYVLYDALKKFDVTGFDASGIVPCTRAELVKAMCDYCSVELETDSFINSDVIVGVYDSSLSMLKWLSFISERAGGYAKATRDGKLKIASYGDSQIFELPEDMCGEIESLEDSRTISKIIYENAISKFEAGDDSGETIFISSDSPFVCSQEEVDNLADSLIGLTFESLSVRVWGDPSIDSTDIVKVGNRQTFAQRNWTWGNGWFGVYESNLKIENKTSIVSKLPAKAQLKRLNSKMDEVEGTIKTTTELVDGNNKKVTEMEQTVNGFKESMEHTETQIKNLQDSIEVYSVDLDVENILIPVDALTFPLETKDYVVNFYTYCKGVQVKSKVTTSSECEGITATINDTNITFNVDSETKIKSLTNEYIVNFLYQDTDKEIYTLNKKIILTLVSQGKDGQPGEPGAPGEPGTPGAPGKDGQSTYFYVRYSENENGNPMTEAPTETTKYMGVANTTSPTPPSSYNAYTWSKIKGDDGEPGQQGIPGQPGESGQTSYLHIMYSEDGSTFTPADEDYDLGKKPSAWIGTYTDFTEQDSDSFDSYTWYKFTEDIDDELTEMRDRIDNNKTEVDNNLQDVLEKFGNYVENSTLIEINKRLEKVEDDTQVAITFKEQVEADGVVKLETATGYKFDSNGLSITKSDSNVGSVLTEQGLTINDSNGEVFFAGYDSSTSESVVRTKNISVSKYLMVGAHLRIEDYQSDREVDGKQDNPGTGFFYVG